MSTDSLGQHCPPRKVEVMLGNGIRADQQPRKELETLGAAGPFFEQFSLMLERLQDVPAKLDAIQQSLTMLQFGDDARDGRHVMETLSFAPNSAAGRRSVRMSMARSAEEGSLLSRALQTLSAANVAVEPQRKGKQKVQVDAANEEREATVSAAIRSNPLIGAGILGADRRKSFSAHAERRQSKGFCLVGGAQVPPQMHHVPPQVHYVPPQVHHVPPQVHHVPPQAHPTPPPPVIVVPVPQEETTKSKKKRGSNLSLASKRGSNMSLLSMESVAARTRAKQAAADRTSSKSGRTTAGSKPSFRRAGSMEEGLHKGPLIGSSSHKNAPVGRPPEIIIESHGGPTDPAKSAGNMTSVVPRGSVRFQANDSSSSEDSDKDSEGSDKQGDNPGHVKSTPSKNLKPNLSNPMVRHNSEWTLAAETETEKARVALTERRGTKALSMEALAEMGDGSLWSRIRHYKLIPILPDSAFCLAWSFAMVACALVIGLVIPYQMAYVLGDPLVPVLKIFVEVVDVLLMIDLPLSFCFAVLSDNQLILKPREIAENYAKSWLAVDLITFWPLAFSTDPGTPLYCAHRIIKLLKLCKISHWLSHIQEHMQKPILSWTKVFCPGILLLHIMTCLARVSKPNQDERDNNVSTYIGDIYWLIVTITTIGYGDIVPKTDGARVYAMFVMLTSSFYSGLVVSLTGQTLRRLFDSDLEREVQEACTFLRRRKVPMELQRRIEYCLRQQYKQEQSVAMAPRLLDKLSPSIQRELSMELLRAVILQFPLFVGAPLTFVSQIASCHEWILALAGDLVVEEGQLETELVFIVQGRLLRLTEAEVGDDDDDDDDDDGDESAAEVIEEVLGSGAWFGECCLIDDYRIRDFTVIVDLDSELAVLPAEEYLRVVNLFPPLKRKNDKLHWLASTGKLDVSELKYRAPTTELENEQGYSLVTWFRSLFHKQGEVEGSEKSEESD